MSSEILHPQTWAVTGGRPANEPDQPLNTPITLASTYIAGGDLEYGRYGNPSWSALEETLGGLEGGRCLVFTSGMAVTAAVLDGLEAGSRVVVPRHSYQGTLALLRELEQRDRVSVTLVDISDTAATVAALPGAALLWLESPTNPALEVANLPALIGAAKDAGALTVVDNTFATPILQQPLALGADIVVHSATKFISGHSDVIMGAVVVRDETILERLKNHRSLHGAIPSAFDTFLALRGLRTLPLRFERSQSNAAELVSRLTARPELTEVRYPGFGAIIALVFETADAADAAIARLGLWRTATSLGGVESTLERRRRWAGESPTIPEGLVRLSVGIEHIDDLFADLDQAIRG